VVYSDFVLSELKKLLARAKKRGLLPVFAEAAKHIDYLLHVYPQFGDPLRDLELKPARSWMGTVTPLVVHYTLDEERRLVMVVAPIMVLPHSDL
jgi:hypothetical protein